jgi:RNA polymerase sigma-70 factor (ECF subfamily)
VDSERTPSKLHPEGWVDRYADYLFNYAVSRVGSEEIARDLLQDTFVAALQAADKFEGNASERTWLVAILKHKIIDHYRRANTRLEKGRVPLYYESGPDGEGDLAPRQIPDPDSDRENDPIENAELGMAIRECLSGLAANHARAFSLKTIERWSTEDICKELEITPSNLWVMVHRARTALMNCLNARWFKPF